MNIQDLAMEELAKQATWMEKTGGFAKDMTLREWYAGLAMQGLIGDWGRTSDLLAVQAQQMADAMLRARNAK